MLLVCFYCFYGPICIYICTDILGGMEKGSNVANTDIDRGYLFNWKTPSPTVNTIAPTKCPEYDESREHLIYELPSNFIYNDSVNLNTIAVDLENIGEYIASTVYCNETGNDTIGCQIECNTVGSCLKLTVNNYLPVLNIGCGMGSYSCFDMNVISDGSQYISATDSGTITNILCDYDSACSSMRINVKNIDQFVLKCGKDKSCLGITIHLENIINIEIHCDGDIACFNADVNIVGCSNATVICYSKGTCNGLRLKTDRWNTTKLVLYNESSNIVYNNGYGYVEGITIDCNMANEYVSLTNNSINTKTWKNDISTQVTCFDVKFICDDNNLLNTECTVSGYNTIIDPLDIIGKAADPCVNIALIDLIELYCFGKCIMSPNGTDSPTITTEMPTKTPPPTLAPTNSPTPGPSLAPTTEDWMGDNGGYIRIYFHLYNVSESVYININNEYDRHKLSRFIEMCIFDNKVLVYNKFDVKSELFRYKDNFVDFNVKVQLTDKTDVTYLVQRLKNNLYMFDERFDDYYGTSGVTIKYVSSDTFVGNKTPDDYVLYSLIGFLSIIVIIAILAYMDQYGLLRHCGHQSYGDHTGVSSIMIVGIQIWDLVSDLNLSFEILGYYNPKIDDSVVFFYLGIASLVCVGIPYIANLAFAANIRRYVGSNNAASSWFNQYSKIFAVLGLLFILIQMYRLNIIYICMLNVHLYSNILRRNASNTMFS